MCSGVWNAASISPGLHGDVSVDFMPYLVYTLSDGNFAQALVVVVDLDTQLWEAKQQRPLEAAMLSLEWRNEFLKANVVASNSSPKVQSWLRLENDWCKCN